MSRYTTPIKPPTATAPIENNILTPGYFFPCKSLQMIEMMLPVLKKSLGTPIYPTLDVAWINRYADNVIGIQFSCDNPVKMIDIFIQLTEAQADQIVADIDRKKTQNRKDGYTEYLVTIADAAVRLHDVARHGKIDNLLKYEAIELQAA